MTGANVVDEVLEEVVRRLPAGVDRAQEVDDQGRGEARGGQRLQQVRAGSATASDLHLPVLAQDLGVALRAQRRLGAEVVRDQPRGDAGAPRCVRNEASKPSSAKHSMAASRICARAVRSDAHVLPVPMLNARPTCYTRDQ